MDCPRCGNPVPILNLPCPVCGLRIEVDLELKGPQERTFRKEYDREARIEALKDKVEQQRERMVALAKEQLLGEKLFNRFAEEEGFGFEEYQGIKHNLIDTCGTIHTAFMEASHSRDSFIDVTGIPHDCGWLDRFCEIAGEHFPPPPIRTPFVLGAFEITLPDEGLHEEVQRLFERVASTLLDPDEGMASDVRIDLLYRETPSYLVHVEAPDAQTAADIMAQVIQMVSTGMEELGGRYRYLPLS